jgi:hypothetical protein
LGIGGPVDCQNQWQEKVKYYDKDKVPLVRPYETLIKGSFGAKRLRAKPGRSNNAQRDLRVHL